MIAPERLAAALERLDPRDAEVLSLSVGRRVPDESLARMWGVEPAEVARRRAAAIDRLADRLGVQGGDDLGAALEALEQRDVWPASDGPDDRPPRRLRPLWAGVGAVVLLVAAAVAAALIPGGDDRAAAGPEPVLGGDTRPFSSEPGQRAGAPFADGRGSDRAAAGPPPTPEAETLPLGLAPRGSSCHPIAQIRRATTLYTAPGGRPRLRLAARTEWKSPRVLGVVRRRAGWLAVQAPDLRNGEIAWLREEGTLQGCVRWSLHADLSRRTLTVRFNGRLVRRLSVAVGNPTNPTPRGRFSVTDKLRVTDAGSPYGCCVLALTGHQVRLPSGWPGGDRLAVHATTDLSSIGRPVSLGCLRADPSHAHWLIHTIPLGSPIYIRS
jgi:hypothetical protein